MGSYFIPFVNLVVPCLVMLEITRKTFRHRPQEGMKAIVLVWWISYLGWNIVSRFETSGWLSLSLGALAALLIAYIILRVSVAQAEFSWDEVPEHQRPWRMRPGGTPRPIQPPLTAGGPAKIPPRRPLPPPARKIAPPDAGAGDERS